MHPVPQPTTPFGRRPLSLAMMTAQSVAKACPDDALAHKWRVFRDVTEAKDHLGVSDRALAVLSALLTFHPETTLTPGTDLVVFPSNRELSLRAYGPSPATLRRALAQLVDAGLVIRRDSPNGKRYARRDSDGGIAQAFGFDLTPLLARGAEFARLADEVRAAAKARALLREAISLQRRDIAKTLAAAAEACWEGPWTELAAQFTAFGPMPARSTDERILRERLTALETLRADLDKSLIETADFLQTIGSESQSAHHHQNSKPDPVLESELVFQEGEADAGTPSKPPGPEGQRPMPLRMVLEACPDVALYSRTGITTWSDLFATAAVVRPSLGISASAWDAAVKVMGREQAVAVLAAILQRAAMINAPGGYLRSLTEKARAGRFSAWPMILALWRLHGAVKKPDGAG